MSEDIVEPRHRDVCRALSGTLASVRGQIDVVMATPWSSVDERDRFLAAVLHAFASFLTVRLEDPEQYLLSWLAVELELADDQDAADAENDDGEYGSVVD